METHEIAPSPVRTMEDLIAKLEMIRGAANQLVSERDGILAKTIHLRVSELSNDSSGVVGGSYWQWRKARKLVKVIRKQILKVLANTDQKNWN
jgi:hypothetical protein